MTLPTRPLGKTGMDITRVGFGTWAIGGGGWAFSWGPQDDDQSEAALRHAVESGINWVDTAPVYGLGHSEEVVGRALKGLAEADRPYIFTKCSRLWDETDRSKAPRSVGEPQSIRAEAEASLRRLQVERLDLLQMHWPATDVPLEDYWGALLDLREEGKARAVGLCNHSVSQLEAAEAMGHVDTLQPPFSALKRGTASEIAWCADHSTGVIVYSPMQAGLLTGAFSAERVAALPEEDWRARDAEFQGERLQRNLQVTEALRPIAERHRTTTAAVSVAWVLAWRGVTGAIVGARKPGQVDGWLAAATLELSDGELDEVANAIEASRPDAGPAHPGR